MPAPVRDNIHVAAHACARDIPPAVWAVWARHEMQANIMLPHARKALQRELAGAPPTPGQFWVSLSAPRAAADGALETGVEMVLSCTEWALGTYPVFVFVAPGALDALSGPALNARLSMLAAELRARAPVERVYSVFAPTRVAKAFARLWANMTGAQIEREPYYSAVFSFCTARTIARRRQTLVADRSTYTLRIAEEHDIPAVAKLCKGFAATSEPFVLTDDGALNEATYLVRNRLVWLHEVEFGRVRQVASIVATTRQSENVSGITKVYTSPDVRKQGCAERLVRHVCQHLLLREHKHAVVLYVAHNNPAAKVYHRVGFQGLAPAADQPRPAGVEDWLELGFRDTQLGHW